MKAQGSCWAIFQALSNILPRHSGDFKHAACFLSAQSLTTMQLPSKRLVVDQLPLQETCEIEKLPCVENRTVQLAGS